METAVQKRATRVPLNRERIIEAALKLVDAEGVEALTIRHLAKELGVEGASLYKHIPNKAALLFGITERMFMEMNPDYPTDPSDWQGRLRAGMRAFRAVGLAHPRVFVLLNRPWQSNSSRTESELTAMLNAGMTLKQAAYGFRLLTSFVVSFVAWETSAQIRDPEELADLQVESHVARNPERYPNTLAVTEEMNGSNLDDAFEFGLSAALAGISAMLARESR